MKKAVLCFSGGLDSTVLLYHLKNLGYEVYPLSVDYGQRHERELAAARAVLAAAEPGPVPLLPGASLLSRYQCLPLQFFGRTIMRGSSQTGHKEVPVPEGHYAEESMKATVVPNRNMVLLSLATAWAVSLKADYVAYAAHAGDHAIYPDCRIEFTDAMEKAISLCDWHQVKLLRPFIGATKAGIVSQGERLGVPFEKTYSCYKGGEKHCGRCGTCTERREAFQLAGVPDPTEYQ